ncbi:MAG: hypothetical protein JO144_02355 [Actinobacteria bacterium]|nr:hypothetical protein [Actinomycetota bacterium]
MRRSRGRRGGAALLVVVIVLGVLAFGARTLWRAAQSVVRPNGCDFGSYSLDLDQAQVASTVVGVVLKRDLPERAAVLTLGAALQESKLRNIPAGQGDRDSVGILQQRPSQGWGTAEQISDVRYATGKFLDAVVQVPNWQDDSLATVVQTVQFSADGSAYARHEEQAQAIADALFGDAPAAVSCRLDKPDRSAAPASVASALSRDLPVRKPTTAAKTVTATGAGWATAAWFVCNADRLGIATVRHDGKRWSYTGGWQDDKSATSSAVVATLAH